MIQSRRAGTVQTGASFLKVCRYVERNPLTAKAAARAEDYRWSSLWVRSHGTPEQKSILSPLAHRPAGRLASASERHPDAQRAKCVAIEP